MTYDEFLNWGVVIGALVMLFFGWWFDPRRQAAAWDNDDLDGDEWDDHYKTTARGGQ